jgi:hypothetical protein
MICARGSDNDDEPRRRGVLQSSQPIERFDGRRFPAEENAGVFGFQRF